MFLSDGGGCESRRHGASDSEMQRELCKLDGFSSCFVENSAEAARVALARSDKSALDEA